jgi:hypothetical protein
MPSANDPANKVYKLRKSAIIPSFLGDLLTGNKIRFSSAKEFPIY